MLPLHLRRATLAVAVILAGCAPGTDERERTAIEITDDAGDVVRLDAPARRVVSLIPARTDAILALGAADRLITRTRYDGDPRIAHLPSIDNALTPSVEWLVAQRPDLIVAWPDGQARTVVTRLAALGIPVYSSRVQTLADVDRAVAHLGTLLGLDATADSLLRSMHAHLDSVRAAVAHRAAESVVYLINIEPPTVAGPGTFIDELLTIAGGRNVFADAGAMWPAVSVEEVLRRAPDHIIISTGEMTSTRAVARLTGQPGWRRLAAVREGRVYAVDASRFNRPGPAATASARILASILHPEAFPPDAGVPR